MGRSWLRRMERRKITLVFKGQDDAVTVHGVLYEVLKDGVLLRGVEVETAEGRTAMGGEVWIPRERVLFAQDLTGIAL